MPSNDLNYVGKLHSGRALNSSITFLIHHRLLHHFLYAVLSVHTVTALQLSKIKTSSVTIYKQFPD